MTSRFAIILAWAGAAVLWAGVSIALTLGAGAGSPSETAGMDMPPSTQPDAAEAVPAIVFPAPDPAIAELLGRSPFDETRRQFQRVSIDATPAPPTIPPRLLGIASSGEIRSALVEWPPSGETQRLTVGMETPQGIVARIGESDFSLKTADGEVNISMFD